eukprot:PhF_6_TR21728/c0_g1_i1/m.31048/K02886/RP-L2, MRPL2, rplB; large subunit ribosomal protein L2
MALRSTLRLLVATRKPGNETRPSHYNGLAKMWAGRDTNMKWTEFYDGYTDSFGTFKEGAPTTLRLEYIRSPEHITTNLQHLRYLWSPFEVGNDRSIYTPFFWDRQSYGARDMEGHHCGPAPGQLVNYGMKTKKEVNINGYRYTVNFKPVKRVPKWLAYVVHDKYRRRHLGFFLYANGCYVVELLTYKQIPRLVYNKFFQKYLPTLGQAVELNQITYGKEFHSLEWYPGHGASACRAAGTSAIILRGTEPNLIPVLLPSSEIRLFEDTCSSVFGRRAGVMQRLTRFGDFRTRIQIKLRRPRSKKHSMPAGEHPGGGGNGSKWHLIFPLNYRVHPENQKTKHWLSAYILRGRLYNKHMSIAEIKEKSYGWNSRDTVYR